MQHLSSTMTSLPISEKDGKFLSLQKIVAQSLKSDKRPPTSPFNLEYLTEQLANRHLGDEGCRFGGKTFDLAELIIEPYPPSETPLAELEPHAIEDMVVGDHHVGWYVPVKTVTDARRLAVVSTIVVDELGTCTELQIFNFPRNVDLMEVLPMGAVILLKEPLYTMSMMVIPGFRVDHPTDIVVLEDDDEYVPEVWRKPAVVRTALQCKELGNAAMRENLPKKAVKLYNAGLKTLKESGRDDPESEELKLNLLRNRALGNIRLGYFQTALRDAEAVLAKEPNDEKALFRRAKALYSLRDWPRAGNTLKHMTAEYPKNAVAKALFKSCRRRMIEELMGEYDWVKMVKLAKEDKPSSLFDFADYKRPVEIRPSPISGNGIFTKHKVKAGDLLCVEKAVLNCRGKENGVAIFYDVESEQMSVQQGAGAFVGAAMLKRFWEEPRMLTEVQRLHSQAGHDQLAEITYDERGNPYVDAFTIRDIIRTNSFSSHSYYEEFPEAAERDSRAANLTRDFTATDDGPDPNCGLWLLCSYFNHSCVPNARRTILGDMMIVRAAKDMPADKEVLISYTDVKTEFPDRRMQIMNSWGFECTCNLCLWESSLNDKELADRHALMASIDDLMSSVNPRSTGQAVSFDDISSLVSQVNRLEELYPLPVVKIPRHFVAMRWYSISVFLDYAQSHDGAAMALKRGLCALGCAHTEARGQGVTFKKRGFYDTDLVRMLARMAVTRGINDPNVAESWMQAVKVGYRVVCGEDESFENTMGEFIQYTRVGYVQSFNRLYLTD
ncbi:hypothetical protein Dda_6682 [Drechslerella dactyloides]|uniref:SET domain-containing protein n=1 Tax=Drechslerella dactyloides TaxID=74499 RepID=A0AAD6IVB5_DREDA|nr:hypothetical protein Dda_6682 [Drechslerella dactyloides]